VTPDEIEAARKSLGLSKRAAAKRAGISEGRWRQITVGHMRVGGVEVPVNTKPETLEAMARAVSGEPRAAGVTIKDYSGDELADEIRDRLRKGERDAQAKPSEKIVDGRDEDGLVVMPPVEPPPPRARGQRPVLRGQDTDPSR
jgi:hypothetical protein